MITAVCIGLSHVENKDNASNYMVSIVTRITVTAWIYDMYLRLRLTQLAPLRWPVYPYEIKYFVASSLMKRDQTFYICCSNMTGRYVNCTNSNNCYTLYEIQDNRNNNNSCEPRHKQPISDECLIPSKKLSNVTKLIQCKSTGSYFTEMQFSSDNAL